MADKEKIREDLIRLQANINECIDDLAIARDRKDDGEELIALRRMEALLGDVKQTCISVLFSLKEEPVSERFTFKAIPRLLEMIEPTDRAKAYIAKLADILEVEGYSTDAKIVMESLKIMNGEKVPMATMDEEPLSEELDKASKEWLIPQLDKSYANYGEGKMMELTHFDGYAMLDAIEFGAKWQKEQMMAKAKGGTVQKDYQIIMDDGTWIDLDPSMQLKPAFNVNVNDKVKVIVTKED